MPRRARSRLPPASQQRTEDPPAPCTERRPRRSRAPYISGNLYLVPRFFGSRPLPAPSILPPPCACARALLLSSGDSWNRLLELAWETYNDPADFTNPNNYHFGIANFERVGFELIAHIFNAQHDTHCFVLQDKPRAVRVPPPPPASLFLRSLVITKPFRVYQVYHHVRMCIFWDFLRGGK